MKNAYTHNIAVETRKNNAERRTMRAAMMQAVGRNQYDIAWALAYKLGDTDAQAAYSVVMFDQYNACYNK